MADQYTSGKIRYNGQKGRFQLGAYTPINNKRQKTNVAPRRASPEPVSPQSPGRIEDTFSDDDGPPSPHGGAGPEEVDDLIDYEETDGQPVPHNPSPCKLEKVREEMAGSFFANILSNARRQKDLVEAERSAISSQSSDPCSRCPNCGTQGGHSPTEAIGAKVLVATLTALHDIELRQLRCCSCKGLFMLKPTQVACIPGSMNAWTLSRLKTCGDVPLRPLWFHMDLLSFLDDHHYHAKSSSIYSFVQVLEAQWLRAQEACQGVEATGDGWQPTLPLSMDTVRRQIADALREYQHLLTMCDNVSETLQLDGWPNTKHNPCSACDPRAMHVHFDLCFGLPMLRRSYAIEYQQPPNSRLVVANSEVLQALKEHPRQLAAGQQAGQREEQHEGPQHGQQDGGEGQGHGGEGAGDSTIRCSEFKADKLVAHDSARYLITAMAVAVCRHGHILMMANCTGGEKHGYAILCMHLLLVAGLVVKVWWYDINCRWERSFKNWLAQQPHDVQERLRGVLLPVPPFHLYAHREACRVQFGHLHMDGAGRGTGENCERTWAELAHHGLVTKYMAGDNRECRLERAAHLLNRGQDNQTSSLLTQMTKRVEEELVSCSKETDAELEGLKELLLEQASPPADVMSAARALVQQARQAALDTRSGSSSSRQLPVYGQYARSRFMLERMEAVEGKEGELAPPLSLVFSSSSLGKIKFTQAALKEARETVDRLAKQHLGGQHLNTRDERMQLGINQWLLHELTQRHSQVATMLAHARYADSLVQKLTKQASKQKKVLARKQALLRQAEAAHRQLIDWVEWAGALHRSKVVSQWQREVAELISSLSKATLAKLQGDSSAFPWLPKLEYGAPTMKAAHKVFLLECLEERLREEWQLLEVERGRLLGNLQQRKDVLSRAVAGDVEEGHRHLLLRELRRCNHMLERAQGQFQALELGGEVGDAVAIQAYLDVGGPAMDEDT